mgnify:FL=1
MEKIKINEIEELKIGHAHHKKGVTGCSVFLFEKGAVAGVDIRGGAPGTRETALLKPDKMVDQIHAIMLAGGSAFGLDAASGAVKYLEENGIGFKTKAARVPIVSSSVLYDLEIGNSEIRPDFDMGYQACLNASKDDFPNGNIGAGMGATIGKIAGAEQMMKGGLGTAAYKIGDLKIGAAVAVNSLGDIINPENGEIIAGALNKDKNSFLNTEKLFYENYKKNNNIFGTNTSLGIVITNAKLNKVEANKIATKAHNGYALTMSPAHTDFDGDTIFVASTAKIDADINTLNLLAVKVIKEAVLNAIKSALTIDGVISLNDLKK